MLQAGHGVFEAVVNLAPFHGGEQVFDTVAGRFVNLPKPDQEKHAGFLLALAYPFAVGGAVPFPHHDFNQGPKLGSHFGQTKSQFARPFLNALESIEPDPAGHGTNRLEGQLEGAVQIADILTVERLDESQGKLALDLTAGPIARRYQGIDVPALIGDGLEIVEKAIQFFDRVTQGASLFLEQPEERKRVVKEVRVLALPVVCSGPCWNRRLSRSRYT